MNLTVTIFKQKFLVEGLKLAIASYMLSALWVIALLVAQTMTIVVITAFLAGCSAIVAGDLVKTSRFIKK